MVPFRSYMRLALDEARAAKARDEVPVGAVIVTAQGEVLAQDGNHCRAKSDPTAHAEICAIRAACAALGQERLAHCDLYVTLEPCAMCAGAIAAARIRRLIWGADDPKSGGVLRGARVFHHTQSHHHPEIITGICEEESAALLREFFKQKRM